MLNRRSTTVGRVAARWRHRPVLLPVLSGLFFPDELEVGVGSKMYYDGVIRKLRERGVSLAWQMSACEKLGHLCTKYE